MKTLKNKNIENLVRKLKILTSDLDYEFQEGAVFSQSQVDSLRSSAKDILAITEDKFLQIKK